MNEKLKEIVKQAGVFYSYQDDVWLATNGDFERFAELIVRECCDWIDGSPATDAGQLLLTKSFITANLKGHFGVEE